MKKVIAMQKHFDGFQIRAAGEVWDVTDDYDFGKGTVVQELDEKSNVDELKASVTVIPPMPQDEILKKVKDRQQGVASGTGGVAPAIPQAATATRKGGKKR
jgi:hypothetical protein